MLKKLILIMMALASLTMASYAENFTSQTFGNITYYNGSEGSRYTAQRFGSITYFTGTDSHGQYHSWTSQDFGDTTYTNEQ